MIREILSVVGSKFNNKSAKTTSFVFELLTKVTVSLLIFFTTLISLRHIFGGTIECVLSGSQSMYKQITELKCWLEGVYVDRNLLNGTYGFDVISSGVGSKKQGYEPDYIKQSFYQWVVPVLLLKALLLFAPRALWKIFEGGMMNKLVDSTDSLVVNDEWKKKKKIILCYLRQTSTSQHQRYFIKYIFCEVLAFIFLIIDMRIMQIVFNDFWSEYAGAVKALLQSDIVSFTQNAAKLFPKQAKCILNLYGPSGSMQNIDANCILPQNTVNEKIFAFLYFWMIFLVIASILNMLVIICKLTFKPLRVREIRRMSGSTYSRISEKFCWKYSDFGSWHLLRLLHQNLSANLFKDLMEYEINFGEMNNLHPQENLDNAGCSTLDRKSKVESLLDSALESPV